jgi:hypothetical protein
MKPNMMPNPEMKKSAARPVLPEKTDLTETLYSSIQRTNGDTAISQFSLQFPPPQRQAGAMTCGNLTHSECIRFSL